MSDMFLFATNSARSNRNVTIVTLQYFLEGDFIFKYPKSSFSCVSLPANIKLSTEICKGLLYLHVLGIKDICYVLRLNLANSLPHPSLPAHPLHPP